MGITRSSLDAASPDFIIPSQVSMRRARCSQRVRFAFAFSQSFQI